MVIKNVASSGKLSLLISSWYEWVWVGIWVGSSWEGKQKNQVYLECKSETILQAISLQLVLRNFIFLEILKTFHSRFLIQQIIVIVSKGYELVGWLWRQDRMVVDSLCARYASL